MDLRENPNWHPLTGELGAGDGSVRVWAEPRLPGESTTDPFCVAALGNRLRLGVADPAATCPTLSAAAASPRWRDGGHPQPLRPPKG